MRTALASLAASLLTLLAALCGARDDQSPRQVSLELIDQTTQQAVPGLIRMRVSDDSRELLKPAPLISRGWGLSAESRISEWLVVPGRVTFEMPRKRIQLQAISGIETAQAEMIIDGTDTSLREIRVPLRRFRDLRKAGWYAANTHLHLRALTGDESDRYLRDIPAADRLDILFISYLERSGDDRDYITNRYSPGRRRELESRGVLVSNGEEHRHNFGPQGEGYGHVMLLGIRELVRPVSIGYGISKQHPDAPALRDGVDTTHTQGGTAIWCHNNWGYEDVPDWLAGRIDAQNIFDGGTHGGYAESCYHYLNAGLRVPFSTGTDWFMYDFARAYAQVAGELTPESWLTALKGGRTFITNSPLLDFRVGTSGPGDTISLGEPTELRIEASAAGRVDFGRLELVQNGEVVGTSPAELHDGLYAARIDRMLPIGEACWLAVRVTGTGTNEFGQPVFAHSSPVYVTLAGRAVALRADLQFLLGELEQARKEITEKAHFEEGSQRDRILAIYDEAAARLRARLKELDR